MRFVGAFSRDVGKVCRFLDTAARLAEPRHCSVITYPTEAPMVVAVIDDGVYPPVHHARREDGSFAVVDGEIHWKDGQHWTNPDSPNDAATILRGKSTADPLSISREEDAPAFLTVWDSATQTLSLVRDRLGTVPAFYTDEDDVLYWGSDLPTLLSLTKPRRVNFSALDFFIGNGFIPAPWTMAHGIHRIPPAHAVTRQARHTETRLARYWAPSAQPRRDLSPDETTGQMRSLLTQSMKRRVSDSEPTGVLLSGGVDSRLLVASLHGLLGFAPDAIRTFTFRYDSYDGVYNETEQARHAADFFGTTHSEIVFRPEDVADGADGMAAAFGEPFSYGLHTLKLEEIAGSGVKNLLSGAGPDGWYTERAENLGLRFRSLPSGFQRSIEPIGRTLRWSANGLLDTSLQRAARAANGVATRLETIRWCGRNILPSHTASVLASIDLRQELFVQPDWADAGKADTLSLLREIYADLDTEAPRDRIIFIHQSTYGADSIMNWNHWSARKHRIRIQFPFNDTDLFDFLRRLPRNNSSKSEFRHLAATLMPKSLAYGPKIAQSIPIRHWFRSSLKDFLSDELSARRVAAHGVFRPDTVERLRIEHMSGHQNHEWKLWGILIAHKWIETVLNAAVVPQGRVMHATG